jgi:hypothetical protein
MEVWPPPGNSDRCENKGFAGRGIRNIIKTKDIENGETVRATT